MGCGLVSVKQGNKTFILYVNDKLRDFINSSEPDFTINTDSFTEIKSKTNQFLNDNNFWFVVPVGTLDIDRVFYDLFPNSYTVVPGNYTVFNKTVYDNIYTAPSGPPYDLYQGCYTALNIQSVDTYIQNYFTLLSTTYMQTTRYSNPKYNNADILNFIVLRSSEIDVENKRITLTTQNEIIAVQILYNFDESEFIIEKSVVTRNTVLNNAPTFNNIEYEKFIGNLDPYTRGGTTGDDETGGTGGEGTYDDTTEQVDTPTLPTLSATDSGFLSLYNPSLAQLQALGSYMWSTSFDLDAFKKLFADPMGAILGLAIVPVAPPVSGSVSVVLGNVNTGVSMPLVSSQYVSMDLGSITIEPYWGAYLDYSPYTSIELYLPFIGSKKLDTDDVMGRTVGVRYQIDLLSGACVALVLVDGSVMYQYIGQCSSTIPITGNDMTNVVNGALSIAGALGGAAMMGASLSTPMAFGAIAVSAHAVMGSKPRVEKTGAVSGMGGMLAVGKPFVTITRPRQALPADQNRYTGYPSFITRTLGTVSGYTEVLTAHLEGMTCTDQEKQQITQLLSQGVFF